MILCCLSDLDGNCSAGHNHCSVGHTDLGAGCCMLKLAVGSLWEEVAAAVAAAIDSRFADHNHSAAHNFLLGHSYSAEYRSPAVHSYFVEYKSWVGSMSSAHSLKAGMSNSLLVGKMEEHLLAALGSLMGLGDNCSCFDCSPCWSEHRRLNFEEAD